MSDAKRFGSSRALRHPFASISCYTLWPLTFCILSLPPSRPSLFAGFPPPLPPRPPPPPPPPPLPSAGSLSASPTQRLQSGRSPRTHRCDWLIQPDQTVETLLPRQQKLVAHTARNCISRRLWMWRFFLLMTCRHISEGWGGVGAPGGGGGGGWGLLCVWDFLVLPRFFFTSQWRSRLQSRYIWNLKKKRLSNSVIFFFWYSI